MTLQAHQLACSRGTTPLFAGLDFEVSAGEALWLAGPNGSGKTSLLRLISGLAEPADGQVSWNGRAVRHQRDEFHRELFYSSHSDGVKDDLSAWENVAFAARLSGRRCDQRAACEALDRVGLLRVARLPARVLSQGQRKRVNLARLYVGPAPRVCVLDEPFNALDQAACDQLIDTLDQRLAQGAVVVYTTHQPHALRTPRLHRLDLSRYKPC